MARGYDCSAPLVCERWEYPPISVVAGHADPALQTASAAFRIGDCPHAVTWTATDAEPTRADLSTANGWPRADATVRRPAVVEWTGCEEVMVSPLAELYLSAWQRTDYLGPLTPTR